MSFIRIVSLSLLVASATLVSAQSAPTNPITAHAAMDLDEDGFVKQAEILQWARAADRDHDGKLSAAEFASAQVSVKEAQANLLKNREMQRDQRIQAKFASTDRNGDGVWDRSEIAAESRRHFDLIETAVNNDKTKTMRHEIKLKGKVATAADYLVHHTTTLAVADANKDGRITADEYMKWTKDATQ